MVTLKWSHNAATDAHTAHGDGWREYTITRVTPGAFIVTCDLVQGQPRDHWRTRETLSHGTLGDAQALAQAWARDAVVS